MAALCDRATTRDNLLHVLGAGITQVKLGSVPGPLDLDVAILVRIEEPAELVGRHVATVQMVNSSGVSALEISFVWELEPLPPGPSGLPLPQIPIAVPLHNAGITEVGAYEVRIQLDGEQVDALPVLIELDANAVTLSPAEAE